MFTQSSNLDFMAPDIQRRQILIGLAASLAAVSAQTAMAKAVQAATGASTLPAAPVARVEIVRDVYFGETLEDPYRWMENSQDPDWLPFLKGQNAHTRAILDALPGRDALLKRIQALSADAPSTVRVQRAGDLIFFQQRPVGADNFKLFVRDQQGTRTLVDPTVLAAATGHVSLDWWEASPDGKYVVYGLSKDGSEDSILHILSVADGNQFPEQIKDTENASPSWLDDGSGFFYTQLTAPVATPERYLDAQVRFHRLGDDPTKDMVLMKRGMDAAISYDKIQMPSIDHPLGSKYVILQLRDVRAEFRGYIALLSDVLAGKAGWTPFCRFEDEVTDVEIDGEDLYLLVNAGTPRGRVVRTKALAPNLADGLIAVPQTSVVIEHLNRARDGIYLLIMDGGLSGLKRLSKEGLLTEVRLPFEGTITQLYTTPDKDGADFSFQGWLQPALILAVAPSGEITDTRITPKAEIDVSRYRTKRAFATAKDGTKIPYTLIYRKDTPLRSGRVPTWISAYGSYGSSYTPYFAGRTLALVDAGAIVGYANVRGGGEYGREWHKAGQLENKPNTWRDLIAVCEELCASKVTSPQHLAIGGRSAGGITVGRAMTERPDLFAAVIDGVGWSNPLRYVVEQDGYGEEPEWGRIDELAGYRALKSIDSYQSIRPGIRYPAVLLTTGVTDPRVAPFHVGKMTARLQAASTSGKPILLRVDFDAGHGIGSTRAQQDREAADTYAFLLWQLGEPRHLG
jgi:prolyl oligopeptidase